MKRKKLTALIILFCFLCGCGETVGTTYDIYQSIPKTETSQNSSYAAVVSTDAPTTTPIAEKEIPEEIDLSIKNDIEVYDKITIEDVISENNIRLENGSELLDTSELGEKNIKVKYIYNSKNYESEISYTVVDTTPPVLLNSGCNSVALAGIEFDLNDYVGFADNYDTYPVLTYKGYVDTNTCGIYPLTATATDSSGNFTTWDVNIEVAYELPSPEDNNERISFENFIAQYGSDNIRFGVDISEWQGNVDFEALKNAGCSFVIIRMGHYYDNAQMDEYYYNNIESAKAAGLDVGVYIYTTANSEEEIKKNAKWISDTLGGQELDFPVVFDWEEFGTFQKYGMSVHDLNMYFQLFAKEMESYGYSTMLYSSKNFLNNFWYDQTEYPVWLAHFTDDTDYDGDYVMWQASCYGRIDGIDADVDLNILYTDKLNEFK